MTEGLKNIMSEIKTISVDDLSNGVYRIYWTTGGKSVASIGRNRSGKLWICPANWISGPVYLEDVFNRIETVQLIESSI